MKKWGILWKIATISLIGLDGRAGGEIASYTAENTATGVACTYLSEILTETPEDKTGVIKVVAKLENGALLEKYYKQCGLPNNACLDDIIVEILIWRVIGE